MGFMRLTMPTGSGLRAVEERAVEDTHLLGLRAVEEQSRTRTYWEQSRTRTYWA